MFTYLLVMQLTVDDITNVQTKRMINWAMIVSIFVSWARFISFFLVIQSVSKLIMTLASMVSSMGTFLLMIACYLVMISPLYFYILGTETILADNAFYLFRMLIDNVYGTYFLLADTSYAFYFQILTALNVMIANVFLLNYLIAILSTVYAEREEQGDFAYKQNKY